VHADGRIFQGSYLRETDAPEKRTGSVIWRWAENGKVIAVSEGRMGTNSIAGGSMTTDPVCGMKVDEKRSEFNTQFAGKKYSFCSENCKREFEADPDEFVETAAA
jgi:YHS domain-containing protein